MISRKCEYNYEWQNETLNSVDLLAANYVVQLKNLEFPFSHCVARIFGEISKDGNSLGTSWSSYSEMSFITLPRPPDQLPVIDSGSFIIHQKFIALVWEPMSRSHQNGPMFELVILDVDDKVTFEGQYESWAIFGCPKRCRNLWFTMLVKNAAGISKSKTIQVKKRLFSPPRNLMQRSIGRNLHDFSWSVPNDPNMMNFTLFWCERNTHSIKPVPILYVSGFDVIIALAILAYET